REEAIRHQENIVRAACPISRADRHRRRCERQGNGIRPISARTATTRLAASLAPGVPPWVGSQGIPRGPRHGLTCRDACPAVRAATAAVPWASALRRQGKLRTAAL